MDSYLNAQNTINKIQEYNAKLQSGKKTLTYGIGKFAGMTTQSPSQSLGFEPYGSLAISVTPELNILKKAPGIKAVGVLPIKDLIYGRNLICGSIDIRGKGRYLYTMIQNRETGKVDFLYLPPDQNGNYDGIWQIKNPVTSTGAEYKFIGKRFDTVQYKSQLFLCSGEENFDSSGLLMLDLETFKWESIPTGKAAKLDLGKTAQNVELDKQSDQQAYYNSLEDFNPSILEVYKDRLMISGARANPFQVKISEHLNPKNFVDNTLGYAVTPNTAEDSRKASTFFANQPVTSLHVLADSCMVGTRDRFYNYNLVQLGQVAELDRLVEDFQAMSGPVNNKAVKVAMGSMYFASNYQVQPELHQRDVSYKSTMQGGASAVINPPLKLSFFMDEYLKCCNVSNSTVGVYRNSVLWSFREGRDSGRLDDYDDYYTDDRSSSEIVNNQTLYYSKVGDTPVYALWPHIRSNHFAEIGRIGLIYSSADNGLVYRISEELNAIDNQNLRTGESVLEDEAVPVFSDYVSIFQTNIGGTAKGDGIFSKKYLDSLMLVGGFADNSIVKVEVFPVLSACGDCCTGPIYETTFEIKDECQQEDCGCLPESLEYFKGVRYFKKKLPVSIGEGNFYNELYMRLTVCNSSDFYLIYFGGVYRLEDGFDDSLLLCLGEEEKEVETQMLDESGNNIVISGCRTCKG